MVLVIAGVIGAALCAIWWPEVKGIATSTFGLAAMLFAGATALAIAWKIAKWAWS